MANAIASLSVMLGLDTSQFREGVVATRKDFRAMESIVKEVMTPLEMLQTQLAGIDKLRQKFGSKVPETVWERAIERVNADYREQVKLIEERNAVAAEVVPESPGLREQLGGEVMGRLGGTRTAGILGAAGPIAAGFVAAELAIGGAAKAGEVLVGTLQSIGNTALDAIGRLDEIGDTAQALGMEASAFQQLQVAARLADAPVETLGQALGKLEVILGDPPTEAIAMFDRLGLSIDNLRQMKPEQQFRLIASSIEALPDRPQQLAAINDLFGKSNRELINLVEGFDEFQQQAARFTLTESQFAAAGEADAQFKRLALTVDGIGLQLGAELSPALADIAGSVADLLGNDATQSALLTGITILRDTLEEVADLTEMLKDADVMGGIRKGMQASGLKGLIVSQLADAALTPFAETSEAGRLGRELEREMRKQRGSGATGVLDGMIAAEKDRATAQQRILDGERKFSESLDKIATERMKLTDAEAYRTQQAIQAGATTAEQVNEYLRQVDALEELTRANKELQETERKRIEEEKRLAQSREQILASLRTPFERATDELQRAIEAGLDRTQLDAFGNKLVEGLLPKGNIGPVTGFQKGSKEAMAFEQSAARADRQAALLQQIRDKLSAKLFDGAIKVEEVEL